MKAKFVIILFALALCLSVAGTAMAKTIIWKMQASYPLGTSPSMHGEEWAKAIEKLSAGRLKIKILPPGAMCSVKDIVNYLEKGLFDCTVTYGGYYTGLIPETDLEMGLPQGHRSWDEVWDAMYNRGLGEIIQEAYSEHNIKWYPCGCDVFYHFLTNFPVNKLSDLNGKKIRAVGIYGKYVQKLGAAPVVIPGAEMYMALKLGTIDGAIYGYTGLKDSKLMEVVKYATVPTASQIALSLLINKDSLKKLPPDLRTLVEVGTRYILADTSMRYVTQSKASLAEAVRTGHTKLNVLSEEEMAKSRSQVKPLWDELAAKSPRMKKGVDIIRKQMKDLGRPIE